MADSEPPVVLVVDDEPDVADAYAAQLEERYTVLTANSGQEALEVIDSTVDVVLLDRRMPDLSGDEVLETIRSRGLDCGVAMITAIDPDFDVIEMPFDDYATKPISRDGLFETVERLLSVRTYEETFTEFYRVTSTIAALKTTKSDAALEESEDFQALIDRRDQLRSTLDETLASVGTGDFDAVFGQFPSDER